MPKALDLVGQRFGSLVVIQRSEERKNGGIQWLCRCDCGNITTVKGGNLRSGHSKTCGRCQNTHRGVHANHPRKDISGQKFGKLTAVRPTDERDKRGKLYWECLCDCGRTRLVSCDQLTAGRATSCGCGNEEHRKKHFAEKTMVYCAESTKLNALTMKKPKTNTSGHKGVSWRKRDQKWVAYIGFQKKLISLGCFKKLEDAVKARELAEKKYFQPILERYRDIIPSDNLADKDGVQRREEGE